MKFLPDQETRHLFSFGTGEHNLTEPVGGLHLNALLNLDINDSYDYKIPLGEYIWTQHTEIPTTLRKFTASKESAKQLVLSPRTSRESRQIREMELTQSKEFMSHEQINDILL
jgi:hypothetical protein